MRRIPVGWSVSAAALGCVLILFAGGPEKGIQGWQPLNDQLEQAIAANHPEGEAPPAGGAGTRTEASRGEAGSGGQALETKAATEGAPVAAQSSKNEAHSEGEAPAQADADAATPPLQLPPVRLRQAWAPRRQLLQKAHLRCLRPARGPASLT